MANTTQFEKLDGGDWVPLATPHNGKALQATGEFTKNPDGSYTDKHSFVCVFEEPGGATTKIMATDFPGDEVRAVVTYPVEGEPDRTTYHLLG